MKHRLSLSLFLAFTVLCSAQKLDSVNLTNEKHQVLTAFINQKVFQKDSLYLHEEVFQKKYSKKFTDSYKFVLEGYYKTDSLCKTSLDSLILSKNCSKSLYYRDNYVGLFSLDDLCFFENNYKEEEGSFMIDPQDFSKTIPKILKPSQKKGLNLLETPRLKIYGIYFSKEKEYALISYSLLPWSLRDGVIYGILKKGKRRWEYISSLGIGTRRISH